MKILLIDAQGYWLKKQSEEVDQVVLPLGLMYLAAYARQQFPGQLEIQIYNSVVDFDNKKSLIDECIAKEKPDIVGIRGMTRYEQEFKQIIASVKKNSQALIIGGGPFISSDENCCLQHGIDIAVLDEGEITFAEILGAILEKRSYKEILGIAFLQNGEVIRNPKRPFMDDNELDALPFPAYDLIDMDKYAYQLSYGYNKRRQGVVYTSRGCPYRCDFCHVLFGKKFRQRSPASLYKEFQTLFDEWNVRDFYIVDDIFNLQKERAIEFFQKLTASHMSGKIRIYFVNGLRGDRVDEEFIDAAVKAGSVWLAYAIETASPRLQKQIQKNLNVEKVKKTIEYSSQKDVAVIYWGMLGIDSETIEEAQSTVDLLSSLPPSTIPMLFSLKPYPGTEAYRKLKLKAENLDSATTFLFQDTGSSYHSFLGLLTKDEKYYDILKNWTDKIQSFEHMLHCTKALMKIGHTNEDIQTAYKLLYRKLPAQQVQQLIEHSREALNLPLPQVI